MRIKSAIRSRLSAIGLRFKGLIADRRWPMALFGMPDYPRYLQHQRAHHPGQPVMSEREFVRCELERKYGDGPTRCC